MRHLVAGMHAQVAPSVVPDGAAAARLNRGVGLALLPERRFDNSAGFGKTAAGLAGRKSLMRDQVVGQTVIHARRTGCKGLVEIGDGLKHVILYRDQLGSILGEVAVGCNDAKYGIAGEANLVDRVR
jgi:hypothetical protein